MSSSKLPAVSSLLIAGGLGLLAACAAPEAARLLPPPTARIPPPPAPPAPPAPRGARAPFVPAVPQAPPAPPAPLASATSAASGAASSTAGPMSPARAEALRLGRQYTSWLAQGDAARLAERAAPVLAGTAPDFDAWCRNFVDDLGPERAVESEIVAPAAGSMLYTRTARYERARGARALTWSLAADGRIEGLLMAGVTPPAASEHLDYATQAALRLPFEDEWFVFWGGRSTVENYHVAVSGQRFAYDFLIFRDGQSHVGDGSRNDQYFCYGQPILAPADGTVVERIDGIPENVPGQMNSRDLRGNCLVLDLGHGEFALLAHFQPGTLRFAEGQRVRRGEVLGRCGNSGNSSEPHLHFHLQDGPQFGPAAGVPAAFERYRVDGTLVERGEPVRGQTIEDASDPGEATEATRR